MRTSFLNEIEDFGSDNTVLTQNSAIFQPEPERDVRFPKRIKHRDAEAVIYGKTKARPYLARRVKSSGQASNEVLPEILPSSCRCGGPGTCQRVNGHSLDAGAGARRADRV